MHQFQTFEMEKISGRRVAMISVHGYVMIRPPLGAVDTGGQVVYVLEMAKKLANFGLKVDVLTRSSSASEWEQVVSNRLRIIGLPCGTVGFIPKEELYEHMAEWADRAIKYIRRNGLKYFCICSHYWDSGVASQMLQQELGVPHVHTPHSTGKWKDAEMSVTDAGEVADVRGSRLQRIKCEASIYANCTRLVATSLAQKNHLVSDYRVCDKRIVFIPAGYDPNRFYAFDEHDKKAARLRLDIRGPTFLGVGRIAANKGFDLMIKAIALLVGRGLSVTLILAIRGDQMTISERIIFEEIQRSVMQLGLQDTVRISNRLPDEQLAEHYRAVDAFVLSSRYEPFGMTAIEAMACGAAVILTTRGGLSGLLENGQHALFVDPLDAEKLADQMERVVRDAPLCRFLRECAVAHVQKEYTWETVALRLYRYITQEIKPDRLDASPLTS